jgi:hypothetical protein
MSKKTKTRQGRYQPVAGLTEAEKRERMVEPLDYLLLSELPPEGTLVGGWHVIAATVNALVDKYEGITPDALAGRLRSMQEMGLTVDVSVIPVSRGRGWQITEAGQQVLDAWRKESDGTNAAQ